jgi:phosphopantothenoylcysteine decarboxylase/phosphopantothenate--cysteine ligase
MPAANTVYLLISGATAAHRAPELVDALRPHYARILIAQTPNSKQLISPATLARGQGVLLVEGYLQQAMQPRAPIAPVVFAPCTFNSLNKLAHGVADNLPLSIASEMIGRRERVVVAASMNEGLWAHPQMGASVGRLRGWGVRVLDPQDGGQGLTLAPTAHIVAALTGD